MAVSPSRSCSGWVQWWPARMATASRSSRVATSWAWASGSVKVTMPARSAAFGGAVDADARHLAGQHLQGVGGECLLVGGDAVHAEVGEVVDGGTEADGGGDVRRARPRTCSGTSLKVVWRRWTELIISPPLMNGGIASSSSARAQSAPEPVGPSTLWPEKT